MAPKPAPAAPKPDFISGSVHYSVSHVREPVVTCTMVDKSTHRRRRASLSPRYRSTFRAGGVRQGYIRRGQANDDITQDGIKAVAIRAIEILTEHAPPSDEWAETLSFAECCARHNRGYAFWFDLHVYLTLVEMAEEIGFGKSMSEPGSMIYPFISLRCDGPI